VDLLVVELWSAPARDVVVGDAVTITAGCDKVLETCRDKFSNVANYRGFPHIPGNDFVTAYARQG
ncbi:MAG: phage BR0599 family protein, partial [Pseudomonadota bacterium]